MESTAGNGSPPTVVLDKSAEGAGRISDREQRQIQQANASGKTPVVFIHGLWLLPSSWDRWADFFGEAGYAPLTPGLARRSRDRRGGAGEPRGPRRKEARSRSPTTPPK